MSKSGTGDTDAGANRDVTFSYCKNFAEAETVTKGWPDIVRHLSHSVEYHSKEASIRRSALVGGPLDDGKAGRAENVSTRTMLTLDYDDLPDGTTVEDVQDALAYSLECTYVAYSTFRHTLDAPRVRVIIPLSQPVDAATHTRLVNWVAGELDLGAPDKASRVINQIMFFPSHRVGVEPWSYVSPDEGFLDVKGIVGGISYADASSGGDDADDDLEVAVAMQPIDLTDDQVDVILAGYPAEALDYHGWLNVGMALYHQYQGSDDGLRRWIKWSAQDNERFEGRKMRGKWEGFGGDRARPITMRSLIKASGALTAPLDAPVVTAVAAASDVLGDLETAARAVDSRDTYSAFKRRVQAFPERQLTSDLRGMLASKVHEVWAKAAGMGLADVKKSFKPPKIKAAAASPHDAAWLDGWVYSYGDDCFINVKGKSREVLKRAGFNGRFNREDEVVAAKDDGWCDAVTLALETVCIPCVYQEMYWPKFGPVFDYNGATYANSYRDHDMVPDADAGEGGAIFLEHLKTIISNERERGLVLDWMKFVYLNAGERVGWALLLHGAEGNGKTYLSWLMQHLIGHENAKVVSNTAIAGRFTNWAVGRRLNSVEEVRVEGREKWAVINKMKMFISNDTIEYEAKGQDTRSAPNFTSYMLFSNHGDAIPLTKTDRRYCIIATDQITVEDMRKTFGNAQENAKYFDKLFRTSEEGIGGIARVLTDHVYSGDFYAHGKAPATEATEAMRSFHVNEGDEALEDALERYWGRYINDKIIDLAQLQEDVLLDADIVLPSTSALSHKLTEMGYTKAGRFKARKKNRTLWFSKSRATVEEAKLALQGEGFEDFSEFQKS